MDQTLLSPDDPTFTVNLIQSLLAQVNTAIPGIIQSFDVEKQRVTVQPALRYLKIEKDLGKTYLQLPLLTDVPIVLPYSTSTGFCLTYPIQQGDECLLIFSQRAMDSWQTEGGIQNVIGEGDCRKYSLSDAMAIIGLFSNPNAILNYQNDGIELRNKDRSAFIKLTNSTITAQIGSNIFTMDDQNNIKISSNEGLSFIEIKGDDDIITLKSSSIVLNGVVSGSDSLPIKTASGISHNDKIINATHQHDGVESGNQNSGGVV